MMIIDTNKKLELVLLDDAKQRKHGVYISDYNAVPFQVLEGVVDAFCSARMDHAIGIYSFIFTPVFKKALAKHYQMRATRYKTKHNKSRIVDADVDYIHDYIIEPTYAAIRKHCEGINRVSVVANQTVSNLHRSYSSEE